MIGKISNSGITAAVQDIFLPSLELLRFAGIFSLHLIQVIDSFEVYSDYTCSEG